MGTLLVYASMVTQLRAEERLDSLLASSVAFGSIGGPEREALLREWERLAVGERWAEPPAAETRTAAEIDAALGGAGLGVIRA